MPFLRPPANTQMPPYAFAEDSASESAKNIIPSVNATPANGYWDFKNGIQPVNARDPNNAGGVPMKVGDMQGALYHLSLHNRFNYTGGLYRFEPVYAASIGGYPKDVVLQSNDGLSSYRSNKDANLVDFNATPSSIGTDWMPYAGAAFASLGIYALDLPVISTVTGQMPVAGAAHVSQGGTVQISSGTVFTLGLEAVAGSTAAMQNVTSSAYTSPVMSPNSEYYLRAQYVGGVVTYYIQQGQLSDGTPVSAKGTPNGASGGGFYSTPIDICLARIITGAAGTIPKIQRIINKRSNSFSLSITGSGSLYLPFDPFMRSAELIASNPTPHSTLLTELACTAGGWVGSNYVYFTPNTLVNSVNGLVFNSNTDWTTGKAMLFGSNNLVGDTFLSKATASFDHTGAVSIWQGYQSEHKVGDTSTSASSDEVLLSMGYKNLLQGDYDTGISFSFLNAVRMNITWSISR